MVVQITFYFARELLFWVLISFLIIVLMWSFLSPHVCGNYSLWHQYLHVVTAICSAGFTLFVLWNVPNEN